MDPKGAPNPLDDQLQCTIAALGGIKLRSTAASMVYAISIPTISIKKASHMIIQTIGIIGAGTMGNGIAQICAQSGLNAILQDINEAALAKGMATVSGSLDRAIKKGTLTDEGKAALMARIKTTAQATDLAAADLIIEAATENEGLKIKILQQIDAIAKPGAIIASNTSSISITKLAAATKRPDKFVGMHFFNPVPVMSLVEVIRGLKTSEETVNAVVAMSKVLGKTPIGVKNSAGFVVNRILCPMINEAIFALQEGLASAEEIDAGMRQGCNHPIGPLALCDLIGLDVQLAVMDVLYSNFNDSKYRPAPLLREMVDAGMLGRKTGRGFYSYAK
jgi:3-hydroxybutyryl-CoA dehydrogenase